MRLLCRCLPVLLSGLLGCGGANSDTRRVETVVHEWQLAVASRNVDRACSLLDAQGRSMIARELAGSSASLHIGSSCPGLIGFLHDDLMTPRQREQFPMEKLGEVSVTGDTARARGKGDYWLKKTGGEWRIYEVPLVTSK
jgi:hypothetical protein